MAKSRRKGCGIWLLFWIIIFLAIIILVLLNELKENKKIEKKDVSTPQISKKIDEIKKFILSTTQKTQKSFSDSVATQPKILKKETEIKKQIPTSKETLQKITPVKMEIEIFFVKYLEELDKLKLVPVKRTIYSIDEPLKEALKLLIKGPTESEEKIGISSVFPAGVKLLSVEVKNGVAYINFNSAFEYGVGVPMLQARLYQVVYTATQFPNVKSVRFLIEGEFKNTFSSEGLSIKSPLTRLETQPLF